MSAAKWEPSGREGVQTVGRDRDEIELDVVVGDAWLAVPEAILTDRRLTPRARITLIYLIDLARRPGWTIRLYGHVLPSLGFTRNQWPAIRDSLQAAGYYSQEKIRRADGTTWWSRTVTSRPATPPKTSAGSSSAGKRGGIRRSKSPSSKLHKEAEAPRAPARVVPPPAAPGAAAAGEKKRQVPSRRHGVTCWNEADRAWTEELTSEAGVEAVEAAARAIRALGDDPLPSAVEKKLRQDAAARLREEAEQAAVRVEQEKLRQRAAEAQAREALRNDPASRAAAARTLAALRKSLR